MITARRGPRWQAHAWKTYKWEWRASRGVHIAAPLSPALLHTPERPSRRTASLSQIMRGEMRESQAGEVLQAYACKDAPLATDEMHGALESVSHGRTANHLRLFQCLLADYYRLHGPKIHVQWLRTLCNTKGVRKAHATCLLLLETLGPETISSRCIVVVLSGYAEARDKVAAEAFVREVTAHGTVVDVHVENALLAVYAACADALSVHAIYERMQKTCQPNQQTFTRLFHFCMETKDEKLGSQICVDLLTKADTEGMTPEGALALLQWSVYKGIQADEMQQVLQKLVREGISLPRPSVKRLMELARTHDRLALVTTIYSVYRDKGVDMAYMNVDALLRLEAMAEARAAYGMDKEVLQPHAGEISRRLLDGLMKRGVDFHDLASVAETCVAHGGIPPATLSPLIAKGLESSPDGLERLVRSLDPAAGAVATETLMRLIPKCTDPPYELLARLPLPPSRKTLDFFFSHGQQKLAVRVFREMQGTHADEGMYRCMFEGLARAQDLPQLISVHRMLKMDIHSNPSTAVMNSLMNAYNWCGDASKAMATWRLLCLGNGPDNKSVSIALDACRGARYLYFEGRKIWESLDGLGIYPNESNYMSLIELYMRYGKSREGFVVVRHLQQQGTQPGVRMLGTLYNTMRRDKKRLVEEWAQQACPREWAELLRLKQ